MIGQRRFEQTLEYVRRSNVHSRLEAQIRRTNAGAKRRLRIDVLLAGIMLSANENADLTQTSVLELLTEELPLPVQKAWDIRDASGDPIKIHNLRYLWTAITNLYEHTPARRPDMSEIEREHRRNALHKLMDDLTGEAGRYIGAPTAFAFDQSAIESAGTFWGGNDVLEEALENPTAGANLPRTDLDARVGHRSKTYANKTSFVFGYQLNAFVRVPALGSPSQPQLMDRFRLVPANALGNDLTMSVLADYNRDEHVVTEIIADRGLTQTVAEDWAEPLRLLGVEQLVDMKQTDNGSLAHDKHGYVMVNGWPHVESIPDRLKDISKPFNYTLKPLPNNATLEEQLEHEAAKEQLAEFKRLIAERATYAFVLHGYAKNGSPRFISPARAGRMRCAGVPESLHLVDLPECVHPPGAIAKACKQATIAVPLKVQARLRQRLYWGSDEWIKAYARRTKVESTFGIMKKSAKNGGIERLRWTRQIGLVKTSFLMALYVAAYNLDRLVSWAAEMGDQRDPLTRFDVASHGFYESDAAGNPITEMLPPLEE